METEIDFLVGMFLPLALGAGLSILVIAVIESLIDGITEFFNG